MRSDAPQWTPGKSAANTTCRNCGTQVTRQFARVFGDNGDVVHACPDCTTYREMKFAGYVPDHRNEESDDQ
ncbi:DUF7563 family protein [Halomontanus rarus]|uniref:DUF7563 family protein n=1 Tax=Halomontanus rarus TaxID=3034020 RepID=UPI00307B319E